MKKIVFIALFFLPLIASPQTVFWTETFNNGCNQLCTAYSGANGPWTFVNGAGANGSTANKWYISCAENGNAAGACGTGCGANATLHVGNDPNSLAGWLFCPTGDCGAAYDASSGTEATDKRAISPTINCAGKSTITANFVYIGKGQAAKDYAIFEYSPDNGATWTALTAGLVTVNTGCLGQGKWTNVPVVSLPVSANNNPTVKVCFHWINNGDGTGSDPSFAANDLKLSYSTTLPVEIIAFKGFIETSRVHLQWITASEKESDYFEIESSNDGEGFAAMGKIKSHGNSTVINTYDFYDSNPPGEITYYRLKTVDKNTDYSYSKVIAVNFKNDALFDFNIFPVPSENKIYISSAYKSDTPLTFVITDLTGREIKQLFTGKMISEIAADFDIAWLNKGVYFLKITSSDGMEQVTKIVKN